MKKVLSVVLAAFVIISSLSVFSAAADETVYRDGDVEFVVREKLAYITSVLADDRGEVVIPAKVCSKAENIVTSSKSASTKAIGDDDNDADDPFGDDYIYVDGIEENAFEPVENTMTLLSIPRYVTSIAVDSLRVPALKTIQVNANNKVYFTFSGSLYSADKTTFIFHPQASDNSSILASVKNIESEAFKDSIKITSVTVPSSVTAIKDSTFEGCTALKTVTLPANISSVGMYAFYNCALDSFSVTEKIKTISPFAFYNCSALKNLTFAQNCADVSVGAGAFIGCPLGNVNIPRGVTSFGEHALGYYYDDGLHLQKYADFSITGYKYNENKSAVTPLYTYASGEELTFIPLDIIYNANFTFSSLQSGTAYLYSGTELKYTRRSDTNIFNFEDIALGDYTAYVTVKHGLVIKVNDGFSVDTSKENYDFSADTYVPVGDVDSNGKIDVSDLSQMLLAENFGTDKAQYDIDDNGVVNVTDISIIMLADNYGKQSDI